IAATAKSRRACGPSFVFLARPRSCDALKSPRNATAIVMTNLHRSPPVNQSKTDLGIVNESQLPRLGISRHCRSPCLFVAVNSQPPQFLTQASRLLVELSYALYAIHFPAIMLLTALVKPLGINFEDGAPRSVLVVLSMLLAACWVLD